MSVWSFVRNETLTLVCASPAFGSNAQWIVLRCGADHGATIPSPATGTRGREERETERGGKGRETDGDRDREKRGGKGRWVYDCETVRCKDSRGWCDGTTIRLMERRKEKHMCVLSTPFSPEPFAPPPPLLFTRTDRG